MDILGSSNTQLLYEFIISLLNSNSGEVLQTIDELSALGKSMGVLIKDITSVIRDLLVVKTCSNANSILKLPISNFEELNRIANISNEERLLRILSIFSDAETALKYSNHPRVVFETAAMKATRPDCDYNIDALLSRIKLLEQKVASSKVEKKVKEVITVAPTEVEKVHELENKILLKDATIEDVKGKLLLHFRRINSEMLWNIIQNVKIEICNNSLEITAKNQADMEFLSTEINKVKILDALNEYDTFDLSIKISEKEKSLDAIDDATERMKKIFGDNIVIIKE